MIDMIILIGIVMAFVISYVALFHVFLNFIDDDDKSEKG